ncbi:MAG: hypothetical protein QOJ64_3575 [Acidobacteriota bacterium]|jgi:hypothetical protein|nr:hypothetical protein [Acidobacteriota bacterium]
MIVQFIIVSVLAVGVGLTALYISQKSDEKSLKHHLWRDIGIAFLVAVIVSAIYETVTRNIAKHETTVDTLNKAMAAFVPGDVWTEVTEQVMKRNFLRRKIEIKMRLFREGELEGGQRVSLTQGRAVLWMSYGYDLYGLSAGSSTVDVQHELDWNMLDETLHLPRFTRVIVSRRDSSPKKYEGDSLSRIDNKHGSIFLKDGDTVGLPPPDTNMPVRITNERYELVCIPGSYSLVMPQLVARSFGENSLTITISLESLPPDVEAQIVTYYGPHQFTKQRPDFWTYDSIMLPGQGFSIVFKPRSNSQVLEKPAEPSS